MGQLNLAAQNGCEFPANQAAQRTVRLGRGFRFGPLDDLSRFYISAYIYNRTQRLLSPFFLPQRMLRFVEARCQRKRKARVFRPYCIRKS